MPKIITIGSALVDVFIHSPQFKSNDGTKGKVLCQMFGDKIELDSMHVYSGGGASNVAVGLKRLGFDVFPICETGRDGFSSLVMNDFAKEEIDTSLVIHEKKEQTGGSVIMVGEDGQRIVLVHRGAASMLDSYDIPTFWLSKSRWVHLSSIAGQEETLKKIFLIISKNKEIDMSWNPGNAELKLISNGKLKIKDIPCRILFLNQQEWDKIKNQQKEILAHISQIVITNGSKGGEVYFQGKKKWHYPSQGIKSVDDTGAGDAFATGYIAAQIMLKPPGESIAWGVANASSVVQHFGAKLGLLRRNQIDKIKSTLE